LDGIGVGDSRETANYREDSHSHANIENGRHNIPAQYAVQHQSPGKECERKLGHNADYKHKTGKKGTGSPVVAQFKKFRNGEHLVFHVIRKQNCAGKAKSNCTRQLNGTG
jgi:hypothetical protein